MSVLGLASNRLLAFTGEPSISVDVNQFGISGLYQFPITGTTDPTTWAEVASTISGQASDFNYSLDPRRGYLVDYTIYATSEETGNITRNVYMGIRLYRGATPVDNIVSFLVISPGDTLGYKFLFNLPANHWNTEMRLTWRVNDSALRPVYLGDRNPLGENQGGIMRLTAL